MTEKLELRPLYGSDIFTVMNLVNKLDLIDPIKELLTGEMRDQIIKGLTEKEQNEVDVQTIGFEMVVQISDLAVRQIPKAQDDINGFLADLTSTDIETIQKLPIAEYMRLIRDFFGHKDLKGLLGSLAGSMSLA